MRRLSLELTSISSRLLKRIHGIALRNGFEALGSRAARIRHKVVRRYMDALMDDFLGARSITDGRSAVGNCSVAERPSTVWVMWWQGRDEAPRLVQSCIRSIETRIVGFETKVLSASNFGDFVDLSPAIRTRFAAGQISVTHLTDIIRANLLANHGGLWVDATVFVPREFKPSRGPAGLISRCAARDLLSDNVCEQRWSAFYLGGPRDLSLWRFLVEFFDYYWESHTKMVDFHLIDYVIDLAYRRGVSDDVRSAIDGLPATSPDLYLLQRNLGEEWSLALRRQSVADGAQIFKMSWRGLPPAPASETVTVYDYVVNNGDE